MPKEKETPDELQHDVLIRAAQLLLEKEEGKEVPKEKEVHEVKANDDGTVTLDGVTFERKDPEKVTAIDPEPEKKRFGAPAIQHEETKREVKDFQVSRAIKGLAGLGWKGAGLEQDWVRMGRMGQADFMSGVDKAVLETGDDSAGAFLVPTATASGIIEYIRAKSLFRAAGAVVLPNSPQTFLLNRVTGTTTGYWIGKGVQTSAITETEPTFGQIRMDLKRIAARSKIDNNLLRFSSESVEALVREDIGTTLALQQDLAFFTGAGGKEPTGLLYWEDIVSSCITTGVGVPDFDDLYDAENKVDGRNGTYTTWMTHPSVYNVLRKVTSGNGGYMLQGDVSKAPGKQLVGLPTLTTTNWGTDAYYIVLGDFGQYYIAEGGALEIKVLRELYAEYDQTGLVGIQNVDGAPRHYESFEILTGVTLS